MSQIITLIILLIKCVPIKSQPSLQQWLSSQSASISMPFSYTFYLEDDSDIPRLSKFKRSITEDVRTEETFVSKSEIVTVNKGAAREKRTIDNSNKSRNRHGPNLNVKAGLRYHHQQRHSNGSVSGSYAILDPKGQLQVMHYVSDDKGYKEFPEVGEPGSQASAQNHHPQYHQRTSPNPSPPPNINIVTNSNVGNQPINNGSHNQHTRRDINPIGNDQFGFIPNILSPYNIPSQSDLGSGIPTTPILHSAVTSVSQYAPRSPLFHKYYRPSPEEVQRNYEYHRMRSVLDPNVFRPPEANVPPDVVRDKPMELHGVYNEYQTPYSVRYHDDTPAGYYVYNTPVEDTRYYNVPQYAPPQVPIDVQGPVPPPQELYPRQQQPPPNYYEQVPPQQFQQPYPENVPAQPPMFFQAFDQQAFPPANNFNAPAPYSVPNSATINQPFPPSIPIYDTPIPQNLQPFNQQPPNSIPVYNQPPPPNIPVYSQPPPGNVPVYNQPPPGNVPVYNQPPPSNLPVYNQPPPNAYNQPPGNGNQNVYYASGSAPQPKIA